ncbi:MAG: hypothetical protein R3174_10990, partial [Gammaproteobacteria bacterium]|nr:hypothetical protein [Gammaproteobacteria bacterium]
MLVGIVLLTASDAAAKWFTASYPVGEVVAIRALFILAFVAAFAAARARLRELRVFSVRRHL